jgi:Siphovirus Gp157
MDELSLAAKQHVVIRKRILAVDPDLDDQTLADTLEGLTDLHELLGAVIRAALADEAMASGLGKRIEAMQKRHDRLQYRAAKRREVVRDVMIETEIKKVTAPDFVLSIRPGASSLVVTDEGAIPSDFWEPQQPRLNRRELLALLKVGANVAGVQLSNPQPVLVVRTV